MVCANALFPLIGLSDSLILMLMSQSPLLKYSKLGRLQFTNSFGSKSCLVNWLFGIWNTFFFFSQRKADKPCGS